MIWIIQSSHCRSRWLLIHVMNLIHILSVASAPLSSYLVSSFKSPDSNLPFNHITINNTGDVYIGARERLYQLSSDLELKQTVDVGPCTAGDIANDNRLLVLAPSPKERLITCGSCDGFCEMRSSTNISVDVNRYDGDEADVLSTANVKTVGVVAIGSDDAQYLYTGVGYNVHNDNNFERPISQHWLTNFNFKRKTTPYSGSLMEKNEFIEVISWNDYLYYFIQRIVFGNYVTHVGRLCPGSTEDFLFTYSEIQLNCSAPSQSYDTIRAAHIGPAGYQLAETLDINITDGILYAAFSSSHPVPTAALCIYNMKDIQERFDEAVLGCINSDRTKGVGIDYLQSNCDILAEQLDDPSQYLCDSDHLYRYASGVEPVHATPHPITTEATPTSIITTIERGFTIAMVGTEEGNILKIHIVNRSESRLYENIFVEGSVLKDMFLVESEQLLLATNMSIASGSQVLSLSLANCSQYQSPKDCVGADGESDGDPFCGWCTLEAKCTRYFECRLRNISSRWLSYAERPIVISSISPTDRMPHGTGEQELTITVQQLPALIGDFKYKCSFDSFEEATSIEQNTVSCKTPPASEVPPIPDDSDHISVTLSIISTETNKGIVSAVIFFYKCSSIETCSSCVTSLWPCYWCVTGNRCTDDGRPCQDNVTIVAESDSTSSISALVGQQYCPQLLNLTEEILIPVGISRGFNLTAANLLTSTSDTYECVIHIDGAEQRTSASVTSNGSSVLCSSKEYTYAGDIFEQRARVSVCWNTNIVIDDINRNHVTLYKCGVNGHSCSRCLSPAVSPVRFGCGWCQSVCAVENDPLCAGGFVHQGQADRCNPPVITDFRPRSGPFEGGTRVEIIGTDLGLAFSNITAITVAMLPCSLLGPDFYEPGMSVSCTTMEGIPGIPGPLQITVNGHRSTVTTENFLYTDPVILSFTPMEGPKAGGTTVAILGAFLNSGRSITAWFGSIACVIQFVNESTASCITKQDKSDDGTITEEPLTLTFDELTNRTSSLFFSFMANPVITNLESIDKRSIFSGGVSLTIIGEGFNLIQNPTAVVTYNGANNTEMCSGNDVLLRCPTPRLPTLHRRRRQLVSDAPVTAELEFDLDTLVIAAGMIDYYPDPVYFNFSGPSMIKDVVPGFQLTLQGANLDLVAAEEDIQVSVGANGDCAVFALNKTSLGCLLPDDQPGAGDYKGSVTVGPSRNLPAVVILYGNLEFRPGWIRYTYSSFPQHVTVVVVVVLVCVVLIVGMVLLGLFIYRRRRGDINRIVRQLNDIELKIRDKTDIVFQALQIDMSEIRAQVLHHKMPLVSTRDYLLNMMFAGLDHLPPTTEPNYVRESAEYAMLTFSNLLGEKAFLVQFIERLEGENRQHSRARVNIASLITVVLVTEGKLAYLTDVLLHLLRKEIEDASEKGRMRSLFKRTETIVEKLLSNWIVLCMYSFLKQHAAQPLYLLYQAIQMQCEKGPVDAITGQTYFSLNFDFILDREVQCREVALAIVGEDNCVTSYVTVLDVDCITQVKQKILDAEYRKQHFVQQSRAHEVDLVWYLENGESRMLRDVDDPPEGKTLLQINTIKSYGLDDDCRVGLVQKVDTDADDCDPVTYKPYIPGKENYHIYDYAPMDSRNRDYSQMPMASSGPTLWHLVQEDALNSAALDERGSTFHLQAQLSKNLSAPQLFIMKNTIDRFLRDFFKVVFQEPQKTPVTIKHLFDFFDSMAQEYGEDDHHEIADSWKSNSLPHHFWVTTLSHPSYVFGMRQSRSADQCISVITNVLDNACKKIIPEKKEDAYLNRVVYMRDLPHYIRMVSAFYKDVADQPTVDEQALQKEFTKIAMEFSGLCSRVAVLDQLYHCAKANVPDMLNPVTDILEGHGTLKK